MPDAKEVLQEKAKALGVGEPHSQKVLTIASTGRHFLMSYPVDLTDAEIFEIIAWLGMGLRPELRAAQSRVSRLVMARPGDIPRA